MALADALSGLRVERKPLSLVLCLRNEHKGGYWTVDQIEEATKNKNFPSGCTRWDRYVAFNVFWADLCKVLDGEDIIEAAYAFWFDDEDWMPGDNKIWSYMCLKYSYE